MRRKIFGKYWIPIFLFLSLLVPNFTYSQNYSVEYPSILTIDRIFASNEFAQERFGPARWIDDGAGYTTLERSSGESGGRDIVRYETKSGKRTILVAAEKLIPSDQTKPLTIANYIWSDDGTLLMIFTNTKRVWRQNTRGDYWVLNLKTWALNKLGGRAKPSTLMFAKFSPDGKRVGYVREKNVYVEDLSDNTITQLTWDASETIVNGTFDWVYEEEFGLRDGFRWSPDSKSIAYWQLDAEGIKEFNLINTTDYLYPKLIPIQYPKVGTINSAVRIGVVSISGGQTTWMNIPGNSRNYYLARMDWADNSDEIIIQHLNRLQNTNSVLLGNAKIGEVKTVYVDKDEAWVNVVNDLRWMNKGQQFTWFSEQDGWRHAFMISHSGDNVDLITKGDYDIISIQNIDEKKGYLYFMASPDNPTQNYLYRTKLNGKGKLEKLSPDNQQGTHGYQISPDAKWAIHTFSSTNEVPIIELVELPKHKVVRTLVENSKLKEKVSALKKLPTEFFRVDIGDGVMLDGWQIKPHDFDPSKKYPLLFHVYGEPAGQTVLDRWGGSTYLWHLMLAQQGYLVMSIDNRGTPAPRGREWRKCVYGQIGILASKDQAAAAKIITGWDHVDENRVGIWGWSGGGSMTLNMMFRYPDLYHTGMSVAPVPDQKLYDTIYQERYMGLPKTNRDGFKNGSPITFAHHLEGNLLVVHGTGDDNVHYQGTERLINELIKHNKHFTMMAYPNRSHGIYEGENTSRHLRFLLTKYLNDNLPPGPK